MLWTQTTNKNELPPECSAKEVNRLAGILPNPKTRVVLEVLGGDEATAYINANYIPGWFGACDGCEATEAWRGPQDRRSFSLWCRIVPYSAS